MTRDELLRLGCEVAGLKWVKAAPPDFHCWLHPDNSEWLYFPKDPALPAYVASLLVDRVWHRRGLDYECDAGHPDSALVQFTNEPTGKGQTIYLRGHRDDWVVLTIAAALVALDHITIEEAREAGR